MVIQHRVFPRECSVSLNAGNKREYVGVLKETQRVFSWAREVLRERLKELGLLSLEWERILENLFVAFHYLKGADNQEGS